MTMKVAFATLGCKVNQYDTATIETAALRAGAEVVPFAQGADVYVVNTCAVTDRADAESRQLARRARRLNPYARVILTGCFAQVSPLRAAAVHGVDHVIGIGHLSDVLRAVRGELDAHQERVLVSDLREERRVETFGAESFGGQTRAFLKVQEGCDLFCTFCIVPFARGRSRSVEPHRVLAEVSKLAAHGYREVVLTGTHLGGYGKDLDRQASLPELLEMLADQAAVPRLRLSSVDPPEVTSHLLQLMARSAIFCPHVHLPVQSGSDSVLRRMNRRYDRVLVRDTVAEIRRVMPEAALGTDVIAGFPGESEAEFEDGFALLAESPFTYLHVFPYSPRAGTSAAKSRQLLPLTVVRRRARKLRQLGEQKRRVHALRCVGHRLAVLVENKRDRATGWLTGYSRNYVRVLLDGPNVLVNREVSVAVTGCRCACALGRLSKGENDHVAGIQA